MLNKIKFFALVFIPIAWVLAICAGAFSEEVPKETSAVQGSVKEEGKKEPVKIQDTGEVRKEAALGPNSPTSVIKKYEAEVKDTVSKYKNLGDKDNKKKKNDEILAKVRQFFDIYELGRLSLGDHWGKIKKAEQDEYSDVFKKLIERSYISKSDKLIGDYEVRYLDEKTENGNAEVKSKVIQEDADVDILYKLHMKDQGWMIYNIIADNTDLVKNYLSQFNSIIGKEGFQGLLKRMKNKLKDSGEE